MPEGISAQGSKLAYSPDPTWPPSSPVGGAVTFTDVAELRNHTPPANNRNILETTTHNEEDASKIVGIRRKGDMSLQINYVPDQPTHNHITGLLKAYNDGTRLIFRETYPDQSYHMFSGFVANFQPTAPVDDVLTADVTLAPTGRSLFHNP